MHHFSIVIIAESGLGGRSRTISDRVEFLGRR
nr:MAG TPA: hypothetical protein [Caudoviricetes sp.]